MTNFVEPFFGSGAVCLACPYIPKVETVNDLHGFIPNFWRAVKADPATVARLSDHPVIELDIYSRHVWLLAQAAGLTEKLKADPDYYDAKIAAWWVHGAAAWIGSGWCDPAELRADATPREKLPELYGDRGINTKQGRGGAPVKLPHLGDKGCGPHRVGMDEGALYEWFARLQKRMDNVRVTCGDWRRVTGDSVTTRHGLTAVFLDPPYAPEGRASVYAQETRVNADVLAYCLENGANPLLRLALCGYADGCGYETLHENHGWECVPWKTMGGYGGQGAGAGKENAGRERVWFSPNCIKASQGGLFDL